MPGTLISGAGPFKKKCFTDEDPALVPDRTYFYTVCSFPPAVCSEQKEVAIPPMFSGSVLVDSTTPAPGVILLNWGWIGPLCEQPCTVYRVYRNTGTGPLPMTTVEADTLVYVDTIPTASAQRCYSLGCVDGGMPLTPKALVCNACLTSDNPPPCPTSGGPNGSRSISTGGPVNGQFSTVFTTSAPVGGGVAACAGLEVFGDAGGTVYVVYADGTVKCKAILQGAIEYPPVFDQCRGIVWVGTDQGLVYPLSLDTCSSVCPGTSLDAYFVGGRVAGPLSLDCNGNPLVSVDRKPNERCLLKLDAQTCGVVLTNQCFPVGPGAPAPVPPPLAVCGAAGESCSLFQEACLECPLDSWTAVPGGGILRVMKCGDLYKVCCSCANGRTWCCEFKGEVFQPAAPAYVPPGRWLAYIAVNAPEGPAVFAIDLINGRCERFCDLSAPATGAPVVAANRVYTPTKNGIESCCLDGSCPAEIIATCPDGSEPRNLQIVSVNTPGLVTTQLTFTCGNQIVTISAQPGAPVLRYAAP
ncbi:MAG: hypothetical protein AAB368_05745, partial [bacterium]